MKCVRLIGLCLPLNVSQLQFNGCFLSLAPFVRICPIIQLIAGVLGETLRNSARVNPRKGYFQLFREYFVFRGHDYILQRCENLILGQSVAKYATVEEIAAENTFSPPSNKSIKMRPV